MSADVNLEGIGELVDTLELEVANATKVEGEALQAAAQPILTEAQKTTAFIDRSGKLRDSLKVGKTKVGLGLGRSKSSSKYVLVGSFDKHVAYAKEVEYGHSVVKGKRGSEVGYAAAHPFLEPAFLHHKNEAVEIIRKKLTEALK